MRTWNYVKNEIINVEKGKVVPISITVGKLPVYHEKHTVKGHVTYTALGLLEGRKGLYLVAKEWKSDKTAPVGAIVYFRYISGSNKYDYYKYKGWFVVEEGAESEVELPQLGKDKSAGPIKVRVKNLRPLPELTEEDLAKSEAEMMNRGWFPSEYDPVKQLYYYWMVLKVHEVPTEEAVPPAEEVETQEGEVTPAPPVEIEVKPKELEVELEAAPTPTAVPTLEAAPTPTAVPTAVVPPTPAKAELVKVYLLSMRLPSKYLVQKTEVKENEEVRKWEGKAAEVASRLEGIRRAAYGLVSRIFAHVEEYGVWIAVTEEAVKEAMRISEWIRKELDGLPIKELKNVDIDSVYSVKAIPVYLEPEHARELLNAAIEHLSEDVAELSKRIEEAEKEQKRSALRRLQEDLVYKRSLLEAFRRFLSQLPS